MWNLNINRGELNFAQVLKMVKVEETFTYKIKIYNLKALIISTPSIICLASVLDVVVLLVVDYTKRRNFNKGSEHTSTPFHSN